MRPGLLSAVVVAAVVLAVAALLWGVARTGPTPAPGNVPHAGAQVVGRIELAPGVQLPPWAAGATVVIYAYALDGPRQPLAVLRRPASALPLEFKLDDTLAPNPAYRLSQAPQLVIGGRLGSGDAVSAHPGDWVAAPQTVTLGTHGVRLLLLSPR